MPAEAGNRRFDVVNEEVTLYPDSIELHTLECQNQLIQWLEPNGCDAS